MEENFFVYQRRALRPLLTWGVGSSLAGALLMLLPRPFWRQFGLQSVGWGVVNVLLAIAGRRRALLRAEALASQAIDESAATGEAERLRALLLFNTGLDLLYVAGGLWAAGGPAEKAGRRGAGLAMTVQGLFLLVFDIRLARAVDTFIAR